MQQAVSVTCIAIQYFYGPFECLNSKPPEMTKQIAFILIVMLRIFFNPSHEQKDKTPFASPSPLSTSTIHADPYEVIRTNSNERLIKKWVIGDNRPGLCYNSSNVPGFIK